MAEAPSHHHHHHHQKKKYWNCLQRAAVEKLEKRRICDPSKEERTD